MWATKMKSCYQKLSFKDLNKQFQHKNCSRWCGFLETSFSNLVFQQYACQVNIHKNGVTLSLKKQKNLILCSRFYAVSLVKSFWFHKKMKSDVTIFLKYKINLDIWKRLKKINKAKFLIRVEISCSWFIPLDFEFDVFACSSDKLKLFILSKFMKIGFKPFQAKFFEFYKFWKNWKIFQDFSQFQTHLVSCKAIGQATEEVVFA